ncbi:HAD family hydrolase [Actinokineospora auranticolor]|uniref:Uncharacterized protein n=1 Tax=Actinokineospora auranticolor TaxID=155976 RepID=A0A2S6H1F8_9PSEU|nr:HAD family hydrolase [Actinokineospora auranticolor]PPK71315.1 hypothetical protein CLV40_101504 [Actinokineospora auranticolor]
MTGAGVPDIAEHAQLGPVVGMIADRSCAVLSLDVFDTLLWRRVPRPTDVFTVLAAHLRATGQLPGWIGDAAFRRMRIGAEQRARAGRGALGPEVSLFDIWRAMPEAVVDPVGLDALVAAEVRVERSCTVVDLDVAALIGVARAHGVPVVLVSDTYFTAEQLAALLDRPEIGPLDDIAVFRSHEHGADKAGGLWPIVLGALDRAPRQVLHIGDNRVADHEVPAALGVRTLHYERVDADFTRVIERESETTDPFGPFGALVDPAHGDFGMTTLRARTLGAHAPAATASRTAAWRYGAAVLGPVLTGFAEWAAHRAHEAGTSVLWCPMREGELLAAMVNAAAEARGWAVRAEPVWLSRQVTSVAALDPLDPGAVRAFIRKRYRLSARQLLEMLRLRPGDVPGLVGSLDSLLDDEQLVDSVGRALTETEHLRTRLSKVVDTARERLVRSLRAAGALDAEDLTLVDLGWGGTIQHQLAKALRDAGVDIAPAGLYLVADERAAGVLLDGLRVEGYLGQVDHPREVVRAVSRSPEVVEQCVNALCGSLLAFDEDGAPVLGPVEGSAAQQAERAAAKAGIRAFQANWARYVGTDKNWPLLGTTAAPRLATVLTRALQAPDAREAAFLGDWAHEDNFGSAVVTPVVPDDLAAAIPYLSPNDLDDLDMRDCFWPALLAASDPGLAAATRAVAEGAVDRAVFEPSGEPFGTLLRYRLADDTWHDTPRRRVRINHNGLSFARVDFRGPDVVDVSLAIPGRPAIVRVDWIEARVVTGREGRACALRWEQPDEFAELTFVDCRWLGGNLVEFEHPHAAVWLPLAARCGAAVSSGQVTVAFAMLPQSWSLPGPRMPEERDPAPIPAQVALSTRVVEEYRARGPVGVIAGAARVAARKLTGD